MTWAQLQVYFSGIVRKLYADRKRRLGSSFDVHFATNKRVHITVTLAFPEKDYEEFFLDGSSPDDAKQKFLKLCLELEKRTHA